MSEDRIRLNITLIGPSATMIKEESRQMGLDPGNVGKAIINNYYVTQEQE